MDDDRLFQEELQLLLNQIAPSEPNQQMKQDLHSLQTLFSSLTEKKVLLIIKFIKVIYFFFILTEHYYLY